MEAEDRKCPHCGKFVNEDSGYYSRFGVNNEDYPVQLYCNQQHAEIAELAIENAQ